MPNLTVDVRVDAPPERVWRALTDWRRQGEWMLATTVAPLDGDAQEVGGQLRALTGLRAFGLQIGIVDTMRITAWEPPHRCTVRHTGRVIRGTAEFSVARFACGARVSWTESVDVPGGRVGLAAWTAIRPAVRAGIACSLRRFADFARAHP
ncbi:MAG: polyketide cyclase [Pseudonocardiales bacterium]|nr:MAG: polyketide cyclase [Pseudonocardiales bacterium]